MGKITLKEEAETEWKDGYDASILEEKVASHCGFKGVLGDLLCDADDPVPPANDFRCPQCGTKDWFFV